MGPNCFGSPTSSLTVFQLLCVQETRVRTCITAAGGVAWDTALVTRHSPRPPIAGALPPHLLSSEYPRATERKDTSEIWDPLRHCAVWTAQHVSLFFIDFRLVYTSRSMPRPHPQGLKASLPLLRGGRDDRNTDVPADIRYASNPRTREPARALALRAPRLRGHGHGHG